jgi:HK97 gp10 family phage protein
LADEWITTEIKGLAELQARMEQLPTKIATRGVRKALRAGGDVFRRAMGVFAPKDSGFLSQHFDVKLKLEHDAIAGTAYIGPQGKMQYPKFASGAYLIKRVNGKAKKVGRIAVASVARFLEFGTSKMAKKPFMTQAFETKKEEAISAVAESLRETLEKNAR